MVDSCPRCGYLLAREEGFFLGAFVINFVVTEAALGIVLAVLIGLEARGGAGGVGGAALGPIIVAAVVVSVGVPLAFYPSSKTLWAAIDLAMHPDLAGK